MVPDLHRNTLQAWLQQNPIGPPVAQLGGEVSMIVKLLVLEHWWFNGLRRISYLVALEIFLSPLLIIVPALHDTGVYSALVSEDVFLSILWKSIENECCALDTLKILL